MCLLVSLAHAQPAQQELLAPQLVVDAAGRVRQPAKPLQDFNIKVLKPYQLQI
jgi:hypothetical protein